VLDEPVSGLDVSIMAQVLNLLKSLQQRLGVANLIIAHNLGKVRFMSDWVGVMYLGRLVESAQSEELFKNPQHPYTRALLSAALPSHPDVQQQEMTLSGEVPSPLNMPPGCRFHTRCPFVMQVCSEQEPGPTAVNSAHTVACHLSTM
jgi:oligopeptide/dipeptide ABC transporter ATP-binding protein